MFQTEEEPLVEELVTEEAVVEVSPDVSYVKAEKEQKGFNERSF